VSRYPDVSHQFEAHNTLCELAKWHSARASENENHEEAAVYHHDRAAVYLRAAVSMRDHEGKLRMLINDRRCEIEKTKGNSR
jgi:hypothetical protein